MAFTILHCCILLSSLACIGGGGRPSFDSGLKLNLGWTTASHDSRLSDERAVPMRSISKFDHDHNVLFIFGDSLFDGGNNKYISNSTCAGSSYPYGYTYFPRATGRLCDGRIVPDFIAQYAGLPLIPPSQQPDADFTHGANFASAGSAVFDSDNDEYNLSVINLKEQVSLFKEMVGKYNETLGPRRTTEMLRKAVYLFSIGGNDYFSYYQRTFGEGDVPTPAEQLQFVKQIVGNITNAIMEIYEQGARKIAFQNVGPLGCLPVVKTMVPNLNGSCIMELLSLARLHNGQLHAALADLTGRLEGYRFSVMDYFSSLYERVMDPSSFGFDVGMTECYTSTESDAYGGYGSTLCEYPSAYVFFDDAHTTQTANAQLAELIWRGDLWVTGPYNVMQLFQLLDE